jgi:hypothetical protein
MSLELYGRIVNKQELKRMQRTGILEAQEVGQLIPVFFSPNSTSFLENFYELQEKGKFKDRIKKIHKQFGGRGDGEYVVFFVTDSKPVVTGIHFRNPPIPNVYEAKFNSGTKIEIREIL